MLTTNDLTPTPLSLKKFSYDRARRQLTAEASDFGPAAMGRWWLQRLYNDAADSGIAISSHHTGRTERFVLEHTETRSGDLLFWRFRPLAPMPGVDTVVIFND